MRPERSETDLLHAFIARAPLAMPHVRVFRRNIINKTITEHGRTYTLKNGIAGQGDAYALVSGGLHIEIEAKAAKGTERAAQEAWRAWCVSWGVPHLVLRAGRGEPAAATVARWVEELRAAVGQS